MPKSISTVFTTVQIGTTRWEHHGKNKRPARGLLRRKKLERRFQRTRSCHPGYRETRSGSGCARAYRLGLHFQAAGRIKGCKTSATDCFLKFPGGGKLESAGGVARTSFSFDPRVCWVVGSGTRPRHVPEYRDPAGRRGRSWGDSRAGRVTWRAALPRPGPGRVRRAGPGPSGPPPAGRSTTTGRRHRTPTACGRRRPCGTRRRRVPATP